MDDFPEELAIRVRGIGKTYRIGVIDRRTVRDELVYRWLRLRGRDPKGAMGRVGGRELARPGLFHALDGVSFDIRKGETVGLIGRNGAGKSTMLKILARITTPTRGDAWIRGRVGSMLEVGTGFHPELTGRENIYLNGSILGMSKREIDAKFDEIVEFSEIGHFLDTPVKRYSSGMYVKLAFSIASSLDNDVLLLDEVLAVGDAAFRKKSLARMKEIAASGRTILFVSHSMADVKTICTRCIWFDGGTVCMDGPTDDVAPRYDEFSKLPFLPVSEFLPGVRADGTVPVVLFCRKKTGQHVLVSNRQEMQNILSKLSEWTCEGAVFRAFPDARPGTVPLFRFLNLAHGIHAFAAGDAAAAPYMAAPATWKFEKILGHVYPSPAPGRVPVWVSARTGVVRVDGSEEGPADFYAPPQKLLGPEP